MQHLLLNLFLLSIPFALFAESWLIFGLFGGVSAACSVVVHIMDLEDSAFRGLPRKLKEMHDQMESVVRQVRGLIRKKADWRDALMKVLPMLDDRSLRMVVLEVLRAEGYEYVHWASDKIASNDTLVVRKKFEYSVVRVRSESDREVDSQEMIKMLQALYDVRIDRGLAVTLGPVTEEAAQLARRNRIKVLDCKGLAKAMVSCRTKIRQHAEEDHVKYTERGTPENAEPEFGRN